MTPGIQRLTTPTGDVGKVGFAQAVRTDAPKLRDTAQQSSAEGAEPRVRFDTMLAQVRLLSAGIFAQPAVVNAAGSSSESALVDRASSGDLSGRPGVERRQDRPTERSKSESDGAPNVSERSDNTDEALNAVDETESPLTLAAERGEVRDGPSRDEVRAASGGMSSAEAGGDAEESRGGNERARAANAPTDPLRLIQTGVTEGVEVPAETAAGTVSAERMSQTAAVAKGAERDGAAVAKESRSGSLTNAGAAAGVVSGAVAASVTPGVALPGAVGASQIGTATSSGGHGSSAGGAGPVGGTGTNGPMGAMRGPQTVGQGGVRLKLGAGEGEDGAPDQAAKVNAQIARGLAAALKQKSGTFTMRLNPDALGSVRIELALDGKNVSATFEASTVQAQRHMLEHADSLRTALESHGLKVDQVQVVLQETRGTQGSGKDPGSHERGEEPGYGHAEHHAGGGAQHEQRERGSEHPPSRFTPMPGKLAMLDAGELISRGSVSRPGVDVHESSGLTASLELDAVA